MKLILISLFMLFITGCEERKVTIETAKVPVKYCIENCLKNQFHMFHNNGQSWGTGSSSMNGLMQSQIYDRVKQECVEFYKDEQCCKTNIPGGVYTFDVLKTTIHGIDFGACK